MKKLFKSLIVIMLILSISVCFFACKGEEGNVKLHIVSADGAIKSYSIDTTGKDMIYLKDFMDYLKDSQEEFEYTENGGFVETINGIVPDSTKNEFWGLYTDLEIGEIKYYDISWGTAELNGVTYGSASKGIVELPLNAGSTYIFKVSTWQ